MEISNSGMSERQRKFRALYRSRLSGWYNGYYHAFLIFGIGLFEIFYASLHISEVKWWEWLIVPFVFLFAQWVEYFFHRYLAHRPSKSQFWRLTYVRHTLQHHQFFTEIEPRFADHKDWRVTIFPPVTLVFFTLTVMPFSILGGVIISPNVGWLSLATAIGSYIFYELLHFLCHVDEHWFLRYCPIVNTARRHHTAHHDASIMMEYNMSIVFPFWDWVYGTSDLDRGLLGHLFNGYSTKHIKKDLRKTEKSPKSE